ncbi:hypothetical protein BH10ACT9_BH10ACT9_28390 [soil metagenome]
MTETTITADNHQFTFGKHSADLEDVITHIGHHITEGDTTYTIALTLAEAERVGRMLVGLTDYLAGRPPRDW